MPQITSAEPRIRIPAWRMASAKKWRTRPLRTSPNTRPENFTISPKLASRSLGTPSQLVIAHPTCAETPRWRAYI